MRDKTKARVIQRIWKHQRSSDGCSTDQQHDTWKTKSRKRQNHLENTRNRVWNEEDKV